MCGTRLQKWLVHVWQLVVEVVNTCVAPDCRSG